MGKILNTRNWVRFFSGFSLAAMIVVGIYHGGQARPAFPDTTLLAFTLMSWFPLLGRVRWPLHALAAVLLVECTHIMILEPPAKGIATDTVMGFYQPVPIATMIAAFSVAYRIRGRSAWIWCGVATGLLPVVGLLSQPLSLLSTDMVMFNVVAGSVLLGWSLNERKARRSRQAEEQQAETRRHVIAERVRIARELHDSLAHNLTLVNAQIGVASHLVTTKPEAAAKALRDITQHTRQALEELRATVSVLRQDDETIPPTGEECTTSPVPGLDRLDALLAGFRTAGTEVQLQVLGNPVRVSASVDLAGYRIVQEALTNATKHAGGAAVRVTLTWLPDQLTIEVVNEAASGRHRRGPGTGHGLIGMRERAYHVNGSLNSGRTADGGYAVTAILPITAPVSSDPND
jgi:signal transduction histidine kinase